MSAYRLEVWFRENEVVAVTGSATGFVSLDEIGCAKVTCDLLCYVGIIWLRLLS